MKKIKGTKLALLASFISGSLISYYMMRRFYATEMKMKEKLKLFTQIYSEWMEKKFENKEISDYLVNKGFRTIAIYGLGPMGRRLLEDLDNKEVEVKYVIDKNMIEMEHQISIKTLDGELDPVDAVIVTAVYEFDGIKEQLEDRVSYPIFSLEQIVFEM